MPPDFSRRFRNKATRDRISQQSKKFLEDKHRLAPVHIAPLPAATVAGSKENARTRRVSPCAATDKTPSEQNCAS